MQMPRCSVPPAVPSPSLPPPARWRASPGGSCGGLRMPHRFGPRPCFVSCIPPPSVVFAIGRRPRSLMNCSFFARVAPSSLAVTRCSSFSGGGIG
eukprot:6368532-Alexandrium_andersonii.AAC.1